MKKYSYKILTKDFLIKEYIINKKSTTQIANEIECSKNTVLRRLLRYNVSVRTIVEALFLLNRKGSNTPSYIDGRTLKFHYCIGCNKKISYNNWLYGNKRCRSCARKGKRNPNFRGGLSNLPYILGFNEELKESIRERDNHQCQICGKLELELKDYHKKLSVHHIDYDKQNLNPRNLISLCPSCHMKTNYDREIYIEYFRILEKII